MIREGRENADDEARGRNEEAFQRAGRIRCVSQSETLSCTILCRKCMENKVSEIQNEREE